MAKIEIDLKYYILFLLIVITIMYGYSVMLNRHYNNLLYNYKEQPSTLRSREIQDNFIIQITTINIDKRIINKLFTDYENNYPLETGGCLKANKSYLEDDNFGNEIILYEIIDYEHGKIIEQKKSYLNKVRCSGDEIDFHTHPNVNNCHPSHHLSSDLDFNNDIASIACGYKDGRIELIFFDGIGNQLRKVAVIDGKTIVYEGNILIFREG